MRKLLLTCALALLFSTAGHAAAGVLQNTTWVHCAGCGTGAHTAAFSSSVMANNYVVVVASGFSPQPTVTLTGAGCSGATLTPYAGTWSSNFGATFVVSTAVAGGACTIQCQSASSGNYSCIGLEITGSNGTVDGTPAFVENTTTSINPMLTTTVANDLLIGSGSNINNAAITITGTGTWTQGTSQGNFPIGTWAKQQVTTATGYTMTVTTGSSQQLTGGILALESSPAAPSGFPTVL